MSASNSNFWLSRIREIGEKAFDAKAAMALAQEIKDCADNLQVRYRASQTLFILERLGSGSLSRAFSSTGKAAFAPVEKALRRCC
jgi:hypothetical protein